MGTQRVLAYARKEAVAHGVTAKEILSAARYDPAVQARHAVMIRLRDDGFTLNQIARWMNRDHSTVFYAVNSSRKAQMRRTSAST